MLDVALRHDFGDFALDVAFTAPAGVTVLFGRSGAGKSTVAKAVAGLMRPDFARVQVAGTVLADTSAGIWVPPHRRGIGYVFQEPRLFPHLSVRRNLLYGAGGQTGDLDRIADMLDITPLLARRTAALSGGEAGRVALGRALLCNPRLLILDEPLAALDAARKAEILPYLARLRDHAGVPMIYVTHAIEEVARLGTTLVVLRSGRVVQAGPVAQVLADPAAVPSLGTRAAGAVLVGTIARHEAGLTAVTVAGGMIWVPGDAGPVGRALRLRVLAHDIIIGSERPVGLSAQNILPAIISAIRPGDGPGAIIALEAGTDRLLARITRKSLAEMGLEPGQQVFAILKIVAVAPGDILT
jgi:molybdate transport system ATP-binding protein